ncbi:hypothetical protein M885DRAFT_504396 [Pelagophyceae sp. CCMP2097]|nr:hypothetical protein M885DRAFT_504396 [Pelagophyceae sp. CCMP2097]
MAGVLDPIFRAAARLQWDEVEALCECPRREAAYAQAAYVAREAPPPSRSTLASRLRGNVRGPAADAAVQRRAPAKQTRRLRPVSTPAPLRGAAAARDELGRTALHVAAHAHAPTRVGNRRFLERPRGRRLACLTVQPARRRRRRSRRSWRCSLARLRLATAGRRRRCTWPLPAAPTTPGPPARPRGAPPRTPPRRSARGMSSASSFPPRPSAPPPLTALAARQSRLQSPTAAGPSSRPSRRRRRRPSAARTCRAADRSTPTRKRIARRSACSTRSSTRTRSTTCASQRSCKPLLRPSEGTERGARALTSPASGSADFTTRRWRPRRGRPAPRPTKPASCRSTSSRAMPQRRAPSSKR